MGKVKSIKIIKTPNCLDIKLRDDLKPRVPKGFFPDSSFSSTFGERRRFEDFSSKYFPKSKDLSFKQGDHFSFNLSDKVVLLLGDSGSGKTTFLRALPNSIAAEKPEVVRAIHFANQFDSNLFIDYHPSIFSDSKYIQLLESEKRSQEELFETLKINADLKTKKARTEFIEEVGSKIPGIGEYELLKQITFMHEVGPWIINSGQSVHPFKIEYFEDQQIDSWFYSPMMANILDSDSGSNGQRNYAGLERFFNLVENQGVLCLDEPEIGLDRYKRKDLIQRIEKYSGQVFIATQNPELYSAIVNKEIEFD